MRRSTVALAVAMTLLLSGCAEEKKTEPTPSGSSPAVGAVKELTSVKCSNDGGVWNFSARLTNSTAVEHEYTVSLSVVKSEGYTVQGAKEIKVTVKPAETKDLKENGFYRSEPAGMQCVQAVTRTP